MLLENKSRKQSIHWKKQDKISIRKEILHKAYSVVAEYSWHVTAAWCTWTLALFLICHWHFFGSLGFALLSFTLYSSICSSTFLGLLSMGSLPWSVAISSLIFDTTVTGQVFLCKTQKRKTTTCHTISGEKGLMCSKTCAANILNILFYLYNKYTESWGEKQISMLYDIHIIIIWVYGPRILDAIVNTNTRFGLSISFCR